MKPSDYDFRQFQKELAALDHANSLGKEGAMPRKQTSGGRLHQAKAEFLVLRERYGLTVADVVAFFPEEEGIVYLQGLIAEKEARSSRPRKGSEQSRL